MDARLCRLRVEGEDWRAVAADLHLPVPTVRARARSLDLPEWTAAELRGATRPEDPNRPPMPPGHERAWRTLTDGTLLAGTPCPSFFAI